MPRDASYVAVYDVTEDRERSRMATVLEGFGRRVQYSAFELRLTPATKKTMLRRLEDLKIQSGYLYLYRRAGNRDRDVAGVPPVDTLAETNHAWVVAQPSESPVDRKCRGKPQHSADSPQNAAKVSQPPPLRNEVLPAAFPAQPAENQPPASPAQAIPEQEKVV